MRVAVTGTPGTGKTSATADLSTDLTVIHLNDIIESEGLYTELDKERDSLVGDIDAVKDWLDGQDGVLFESHLAHYFNADAVVVLRCHPEELLGRLKSRGKPSNKAEENAESEALDGILIEAVERHGEDRVFEIDTTDRSPVKTAREIERVIAGDREPTAGTVDFTGYL